MKIGLTHNWICVALVASGLLGMAMSSRALLEQDSLVVPVNPFGINRSPFGEIFAMAMQGPIDTFWHQGYLANSASESKPQAPSCATCGSHDGCGHGLPEPGKGCDGSHVPWNVRLRSYLESLEAAGTARTNTHRPSTAFDLHIRRQVEDKLRFAYHLDPAHYGNYNSYHFFLTEPQVGTRPILTPQAAKLAQETIDYCLAEAHDPRPALTAAAAATNVIHLIFADQRNPDPVYSTAQMRDCLTLLDQCIARHLMLRDRWIASGQDQLLSPMRILEMEERFAFVKRIRDAAEVAVVRFEEMAVDRLESNEN